MIVFKNNSNKSGFTLPEVLLSLAIIALILTPIFINQAVISRNVGRASRMLARIFVAKKILLESELALAPETQELKSEKKVDIPRTTFLYELKKISDTSALKNFKNVLIESISWSDTPVKGKQDRLVTLLYKPEQK